MVVKLAAPDLRQLTKILSALPHLNNEQQRRQLLLLSGLSHLTPYIDISGQAFVAITEIVTYLAQFGRISYDQEALGIFLNTLLEMEFIRGDERLLINDLMDKYAMMVPVAEAPTAVDIDTVLDITPEKIIGENTLRPIAFLAQGLQVSRAVCYIVVAVPGRPAHVGTGFLIAPNMVISNHHVLPDMASVQQAVFRFNFEETFDGKAVAVTDYRHSGIYHANEKLDYALVQLNADAGARWGYLPLRKDVITPQKGERVNIIQHPGGRPKHISLQNNFVEYSDKQYLQYITATQPGSSGSPVMNDNWQVVALHHAGGHLVEPASGRTYFRNQGICIPAILNDLPQQILGQLLNR